MTKPNAHKGMASPVAGSKGFALVATVSMMVLLSVVAVAMLGLSTVTMRSKSQESAEIEARANARMALMIALGELQKCAGPDRAITATSEILSSSSSTVEKPRMTGVWESWDLDPNANPDYIAAKTTRFKRWLVSGEDAAASLPGFVKEPWSGETVVLAGKGTLGDSATDADKVIAGLVPLTTDGKQRGSYAWHVADESVKARVNLYRDPSQNTTLAQKRALLSGHRPDPSVLESSNGDPLTCFPTDHTSTEFANASVTTGKILNLNQAELLDGAEGKIKPLRHDITTHSLGVMSDVRGGGLKQDLSSMFEMGSATANTLPAEFAGKRLYASTHGITDVSDPKWSALCSYYNSFRNLTNPETIPKFTPKPAALSTNPVPDVYNPAPVIAKVDTIFSLIARPCNEVGWMYNNGSGALFDYFVNLIFTPVVTLHNPYNVNISFHKMEVTFTNIPVAFNFTLISGGGPPGYIVPGSQSVVSGTYESLNTMVQSASRGDKKFVMTIADWTGNQSITLKPGQTLVCGPTFDATRSFKSDAGAGTNTVAYDWQNTLSNNIKASPTFTPGLGFEITANTIKHMAVGGGGGAGWAFFFLRDQSAPHGPGYLSQSTVTDRFYVESKIQRPDWYTLWGGGGGASTSLNMRSSPASFAVTAKLQATASDTLVDYANLQFDYGDSNYLTYSANSKPAAFTTANNNLNNIFNNRTYRYPPTPGSSYTATQLGVAPAGVTYGQQSTYVHPFAIFSVYSRTTNGGVYNHNTRAPKPNFGNSSLINQLKDGRLAGKPYLFHNPSLLNFTTNLATQKPGAQAYELNFQPFSSDGEYQDYFSVDAANRVPSLSGNTTYSGIKSGSYIEIPSGPLQTIADFRRSNALATAYPPYFTQPVGNSLLHPLMSANSVKETNAAFSTNVLLDHSVLANHALYDRFYFSTFATRLTNSGTDKPDVVFEEFMNGSKPLASQAFQPYLPVGKTVAAAKAELYAAGVPLDGAYKTAAEYQMLRGPFNVNSTSVQAWKAVLASMKKSDVVTLWARNSTLETKASTGTPIAGMSMSNGGALSNATLDPSKIDDAKTNTWNGYRELTDDELERLAEKIVDEVRARGPFLSMSEFVNRQIGPTDEKTLGGALETAIAKAEINEKLNATSADSFLNQVPVTASSVSDPKLYSYKTPEATLGNPAAGAPGWVSQGDLMRILEPSATVRGDTFVIRTYGEALDSNGKVMAKAYAEAVVQRYPEYVDASDRPSVNAITDPAAKPVNKLFGRRFQMVSFRWLSTNEI